jgi:hypothetical protein
MAGSTKRVLAATTRDSGNPTTISICCNKLFLFARNHASVPHDLQAFRNTNHGRFPIQPPEGRSSPRADLHPAVRSSWRSARPLSRENPEGKFSCSQPTENNRFGEIIGRAKGGPLHPRFSSLKKSAPLSSITMKAGKSSTSMRQIASIPSSGYSSTSTFRMQSCASRAAGPPTLPR